MPANNNIRMRTISVFQISILFLLQLLSNQSLSAQETWLVPRRLTVPGDWGYADSLTGQMVIPPKYVMAGRFDANLAVVCKHGAKYDFIDRQGNELQNFSKSDRITRIQIPVQDGGTGAVRYLILKKDKYGLVDPGLNLIIPVEYKNILVQGHLLLLVQPDPNEKYAEIVGAARPDGKIIVPVKYKKIEASGYLVLGRSDTWSYLGDLYNLDGRKLSDERVSIQLKEQTYRNKQGKAYVKFSYYPGMEKEEVTGITDSAGNVILPFEYRYLEFPSSKRPGLFTVDTKNHTTQLLSEETFKVVAEAKKIHNLNSRLICLNNDSLNGFINYEGKVVYPLEKMEYTYKDGFIRIKKDGKYGFLDSCAVKITDCIYDEVGEFYKGEVHVHAYNKFSGYIDSKGNPVGKNAVLNPDYKENLKLDQWLKVNYKDDYCEAKFSGSVIDVDILGTMMITCSDPDYICTICYRKITPNDNGERWVFDYIQNQYGQVEEISVKTDPVSNKFISGTYMISDSKDFFTRIYLTQSKTRFFVLMVKSSRKDEIPDKKYFDRFKLNFNINKYAID